MKRSWLVIPILMIVVVVLAAVPTVMPVQASDVRQSVTGTSDSTQQTTSTPTPTLPPPDSAESPWCLEQAYRWWSRFYRADLRKMDTVQITIRCISIP
ncbi:MAG: hypothetical protein P8Y68_15145 [Anaerolineales bacterium]